MQFREWGEDPFIDYVARLFPAPKSLVGIGDDCAVIPGGGEEALLVTTDALLEGIHFLKEQILPQDLGYKTLAVSVSDIAAMGGVPKYAFLTLALPKSTDCTFARLVLDGIKEACDKWGILLLGGDTIGSKKDLFLSITLLGSGAAQKIKYRSTAQAGDLLCVTGYLGDSGGGLKALQLGVLSAEELIRVHFRPEPSPAQGMWLAAREEVHAMMDISDGLDCDLRRLMSQSGKGAVVETSLIPRSQMLGRVCKQRGWDALELALVGGEDYVLLVTVEKKAFEGLADAFEKQFGTPLFPIGRVCEGDKIIYQRNGQTTPLHYTMYDHFR